MTALGCEAFPKSVTKQVQINPGHKGVRYKTITVPQGSSHFIHVRDTIGSAYLWTPQQQLSSYNTQYTEFFATGEDIKYLIGITDGHTCVTTDTLLMQILKKPGYYLATAFTPNSDGLNDFLTPYLIGMKSLKSFSVFNRWGNMVFHSVKYGESWDGRYKGQDAESGVYVWTLEYLDDNNNLIKQKGTVTVIR
ncbi:MAG: gliding motility-associated C-terminal domain-containing protein [Chitinophagaceae bacterium]|nr:gliding motility-associated C-terminal domain-containing protein [Chitinophagaceae bacterium]